MTARPPLAQISGTLAEIGGSDQILAPAGAQATPSVAIGESSSGFYLDAPGVVGMSYGGSVKIKFWSTPSAAQVQRGSSDYTAPFVAGSVTPQWQMLGSGGAANGGASMLLAKAVATSIGGFLILGKTRSAAYNVAGVAVASGDSLGQLQFAGDDGSDAAKPAFMVGGYVYGLATENWTTTANGTAIILQAAAKLTTTPVNVARFDADNGFQMGGTNIVVDSNRIFRLRVYTVATLPAAGTAGRRAMVSDANATTYASIVASGGANKIPVYDDGTNWRIG